MQKLKTNEIPLITESVLRALAKNRITTIVEFLQEDVTKLCTITKMKLPQLLDIRNDIFEKYSAPIVNGTALLFSLGSKKHICTGIERLDIIIEGGIPIGYITEVCGLADSGKTQLCFQLTVNCVRNSDSTVLYIDTKGDFSAVRIQKILEALGLSHKEMALIMYRIKVVHVWTLEEIIELLKNIKNKTVHFENLAMIIVDSLPSLMFQFLGDDNKIGKRNNNMALDIWINSGRMDGCYYGRRNGELKYIIIIVLIILLQEGDWKITSHNIVSQYDW